MYCRFLRIFVCESDNSKSVDTSKYLNIWPTLLDLTDIISLIIIIIVSDGDGSCGREDKVRHIKY